PTHVLVAYLQPRPVVFTHPPGPHLVRCVRAEDRRSAPVDARVAKHSRSGQLDCFVAELDALGTGRDHELVTEVRAAVHDGDAAGPVPVTDLDRQADEPVGPEVVAAGVLDPEARESSRLDRKNSTSAVPPA